jgi:hypothetical protein
MPAGWSAKDERMAQHIVDGGASKQVAMATVNKYRSRHGRTKRSRRRRSRSRR